MTRPQMEQRLLEWTSTEEQWARIQEIRSLVDSAKTSSA